MYIVGHTRAGYSIKQRALPQKLGLVVTNTLSRVPRCRFKASYREVFSLFHFGVSLYTSLEFPEQRGRGVPLTTNPPGPLMCRHGAAARGTSSGNDNLVFVQCRCSFVIFNARVLFSYTSNGTDGLTCFNDFKSVHSR